MKTILVRVAAAFGAAMMVQAAHSAEKGLTIPFSMPYDGKVTVTLDDAEGHRVRNLLNGISYAKGKHFVEWDGRAEDGTGAAAGKYTIRVVTHPGIGYDFKGCFAAGGEQMFSGFGPNHLPCTMLAPAGECMVAAALFTEGGNSTLVLSHDGKLLTGHADGWNLGNKACVYLPSDGHWIYSLREGDGNRLEAHGYGVDVSARRSVRLEKAEPTALKGATRVGGRVYVANGLTRTIDVYALDESGDVTRLSFTGERKACAVAGPLCADGDGCLSAFKEEQIAIAVKGGEIYALERGSHVVHVYDKATKKPTRVFGKEGGGYAGPWDRNRLVEPTALAFDSRGSLWIAESRFNPKRISRWNAEKGVCEYEKLGSEKYGSPGCGMDSADATHWIAHDTEWRYDPERGVDYPIASLFNEKISQANGFDRPRQSARTYRFVHRGSRTFVIGVDGATSVWEYLKDERRLKPLAMFGSSGFYSHMIDRNNTCEPMKAAYNARFGKEVNADHYKYDEQTIMVWHDRNGDEIMQAEEFEFAPRETGATGGWGLFASDLDFTCCIYRNDTFNLIDFKFPDYSMEAAMKTLRPLRGRIPTGTMPQLRTENYTTSDRHFIYPSLSPYMLGFEPDGKLAWYMKNPCPGVHGSHGAPMPRPGELQGILFPLGSVPGGAKGEYEVCAFKNNHGRIFFITSDGVYLDEIFSDCRVACANDETYIGGESFGGSFAYDEKGGRAVLTSGGGGYRWYDITHLKDISELRLTRAFTARELLAAQERNPLVAPEQAKRASLAIPDTEDLPRVAEWRSGEWIVRLHARRRDGVVRVGFQVEEPSPWVNNGTDPYLMFKTGDCVDVQYLDDGGHPCRLLLHPDPADKSRAKAVLYRHEAKGGVPHDFASPWRRHTVGDVSFPTDLNAKVRRGGRDYEVQFDLPGKFAGNRTLKCDFGVIFGDRDGTINQSRVYWSNKDTGLVNDVPGEIMPEVGKWGTARLGGEVATASSAPAPVRTAARLKALPKAVNPAGLVCGPNGRGFHGPVYAAGPVYDPKRSLVYASAGQGRVNAMTLDGRPAATYTLPGARAFDRFDGMAFDEAKGEVYVIAGGLATQDPNRPQPAAGLVYRITPGRPEAVCIASNLCAISQHVRNGRLACMTPQSTLDWLDCATGVRTVLCSDPIRLGAPYPCMIDFLGDGTPIVFAEHFRYFLVDRNGRLSDAKFPFGGREISMTRGAILGNEAWMLSGGTIKRYEAPSMKPAPGVVYGGASGFFIGYVRMDGGMNAVGICKVGANRYAVLSAENSAVYLMEYDTAHWQLVPKRRLGGVADPCNFMIDDDGIVVADSLAWRWGAAANAPTYMTLTRMPPRVTAPMPDGQTLYVTEMHGSRLEFRHGKLVDGDIGMDWNRDSRPYPEGANNGGGQRWDAYRPVSSFVLPAAGGGRSAMLKACSLRRDGVLSVFIVDREGHPADEKTYWRTTTLPKPTGREGDEFTSIAPLPDGRLVAQLGGEAYLYEPAGEVDMGGVADRDWKVGARVPELDGDGIASDGATLAVVDSRSGTLAVCAYANASVRRLDRVSSLKGPKLVAIRGDRVAVWEGSAQRIACFELEKRTAP